MIVGMGLALLVAAAVVSLVWARTKGGERLYEFLALGGCALLGVGAGRALVRGVDTSLRVPANTPGGDWVFGIDALSAVFLIGVAIVGAAGVAFGVPYLAKERSRRWVGLTHATFALVLAALALVTLARAVVPFLAAWEIMALGSYFLIITEFEREEVRQAGFVYLVATHAGTLALAGMFAAWSAHSANWTFAALALGAHALPAAGALVLALATIGFGIKAGIIPLHFWLPTAHAAAPTHVSALLSGIVIKAGIYGLLRVVMLLGGSPPPWWGWMMLALGVVSGVFGVLWALAQHDIKRLLAYHSVENIGIIVMGLGVGALGSAYGHPLIAVLGYAGAALHTINHALFKSLLFLGAGAVQRSTGRRDLDALGGLARAMPYTWLAFVVGATAIIGVPPLNGFVSEWVVYQALFKAAQASETLRLAVIGVPSLALIGGLALACFAKVGGVVFLGQPRTSDAAAARETAPALLAPMFGLAWGCLVLGLFPSLGIGGAARAGLVVANASSLAAPDVAALSGSASAIGMVALTVLGATALVAWLRNARLRTRTVGLAETWGCGYEHITPRMQYTASSFAAPLVNTFGDLSGVHEVRTPTSFHSDARDVVLDRMARPAWTWVRSAALRLRPLQQGRLSLYLLYVMAALLALLVYLALTT